MIEKMHRLSLFLFYNEKKRILRALQGLGVVDLDFAPHETGRMQRAEQQGAEIKKILATMSRWKNKIAAAPETPRVELPPTTAGQISAIRTLFAEKDQIENALRELAADRTRYEVWGEIPVEKIGLLKQQGIGIHLFSGSEKFFDQYDFSGHCVEVLARGNNIVRFVLLTLHADAPVIPFQNYPIPGRSVAEMRREAEFLEGTLRDLHQRIGAFAASAQQLRLSAAHLETQRRFEQAKHSLLSDSSNTVFQIQGYFPEHSRVRLESFLERHQLAYQITAPEKPDEAPVQLKNGRFAALFEPITRIFALPEYRELDPTPLFAPFFTLFFGFCMGDVGYGAIMLLMSLFLLTRKKLRPVAWLALILSGATIASGLLMNSFFGSNLFVREGQGILSMAEDPALFAAYTVQGRTVFPAMTLSLLIGCLQTGVAFLLRSVNEILVLGWKYAVKAFSMLLMTASAFVLGAHADFLGLGFNSAFVIGPLPVGAWLTTVPLLTGKWALAMGLILFFFFGNPGQKIWLRPLGGLWDFYGFATGLLGDFLSYIRLFALALAGGLLGNAFNQIAFMLLPGTPTGYDFASPWIIVTILVLVIGHTLNFGLGLLGAFVHPLRLTFVEFYKNMNFRGGGRPYKPFSHTPALP